MNIQYFFFWLTSLCMINSRFIHITNYKLPQYCSFLWLSNIPLYICTTTSLCICWWIFSFILDNTVPLTLLLKIHTWVSHCCPCWVGTNTLRNTAWRAPPHVWRTVPWLAKPARLPLPAQAPRCRPGEVLLLLQGRYVVTSKTNCTKKVRMLVSEKT